MSTVIWKGDAVPVAQVTTCTVGGTIEADDIFRITIGSKTLKVTAGSTAAATVAAGIVSAFNALPAALYPEFSGAIVAAATGGGNFTLTARTAGVPFTVTLSTTEAGGGASDGQTFNQSATIAADGGAFWSTPANWSTGAVPVDSDHVIIQNTANPILYGLDQSSIQPASLVIDQSFTGTIGLPRVHPAGYTEYRETWLRIGAAAITIGRGDGAGSGRVKIDTGADQTAIAIHNSGTPAESGVRSVLWKGTHVGNTVHITKGSFAAGNFAGDAVKIATLKVGFRTNVAGDADVRIGPDCSQLTTIVKLGGQLELNFGFTSFEQRAGETAIVAGTPGTIVCTGGKVVYKTAGTLTAGTAAEGGEVDFSQDLASVTVTNFTLRAGGALRDPAKRVTFTNPIALVGRLADVTLDLGDTFNLQRS